MKTRLLFILVLIVLLTFGLSLALAAGGSVAEGKGVFEKTCIACHGKDGSANTPMGKSMKAGDLRSDAVQKQSDDDLTKTIAKGKGKMVPYEKTIGAAKVVDVVAYIRTLKK
jgi:mono/diheme cytochrome c family protein